MSGESTSRTNRDAGPDQSLADNPMAQQIRNHKQKLEGIRKKLNPQKLDEVLGTTVKKSFIPDIVSVFTYIDNVKRKQDLLPYIREPDFLYKKLEEIILALHAALKAWNLSEQEDDTGKKLDAVDRYTEKLMTCYRLLKEALDLFKPIEQAQQGTITEGNTKPPLKKSS